MTALRPYQATAVESALRALATSGSAVLQMPTGAGKTKAATAIIERADKPVWFICHRQEIERQAAAAFTAAGIEHGIVSPRAAPEYDKPVQIVSVATLARRIADLPLPALVIWDECHHVAAKSWAKIREALGDGQHLGLTATPERLDGKGLSDWFNELIIGPSTRELIDGGWLSDFTYYAPSEPDLTGARLQAGDYAKKDLARVMNMPVLIGDAIAEYRQKADGKRALVFCASVDASRELVARFNAEGIPARHVDGTTPTPERDDAVAALASGGIKILSNVEVFTEGFDLPAIDAVFLLRPTKSLALFLQMIGRALRKAEGKDEALIFDHAGLWLDHDWFDLPISWSLDGGARLRRLAGRTVGPRRCPSCKEVRLARLEVCECGYEFPTGREIGEYDGQLMKLRGAVPDGCCTVAEFARITGINNNSISNWIDKEDMPNVNRYPVRMLALEWIRDRGKLNNIAKCNHPDGYDNAVNLKTFSDETGVDSNSLRRLISRGMPAAPNGWPLRDDALLWLRENYKSRTHPPFDVDDPENYVSPKEFEERMGLGRGYVCSVRNKGIPAASNGWIHLPSATEWARSMGLGVTDRMRYGEFASHMGVKTHVVQRWAKEGMPVLQMAFVSKAKAERWVAENASDDLPPPDDDEYLTTVQFAKILGVHFSTFRNGPWKNMPRGPRGSVPKNKALGWVRKQKFPKLPPMDVSSPKEYEPRGMFCMRLGFSDTWASVYAKRGLPCASNGWVHIQRGLEWVRDNTNITIPPEAWPSANDNSASAHAEAA